MKPKQTPSNQNVNKLRSTLSQRSYRSSVMALTLRQKLGRTPRGSVSSGAAGKLRLGRAYKSGSRLSEQQPGSSDTSIEERKGGTDHDYLSEEDSILIAQNNSRSARESSRTSEDDLEAVTTPGQEDDGSSQRGSEKFPVRARGLTKGSSLEESRRRGMVAGRLWGWRSVVRVPSWAQNRNAHTMRSRRARASSSPNSSQTSSSDRSREFSVSNISNSAIASASDYLFRWRSSRKQHELKQGNGASRGGVGSGLWGTGFLPMARWSHGRSQAKRNNLRCTASERAQHIPRKGTPAVGIVENALFRCVGGVCWRPRWSGFGPAERSLTSDETRKVRGAN